jgi:hypothetical protein
MRPPLALRCLVVVGLLAVPGVSRAGFVIDTQAAWDGSSSLSSFGDGAGAIASFGQTFTATSENTLQDFSFWLRLHPPADPPGPRGG